MAVIRKVLPLPLVLLGIGGLALVFSESVFQSKHNLSISSPGTVTAATEGEVCIFCHTPHNAGAEAPLWNRFSSGSLYQTYSSSTAIAAVGQPSGASKLCLSCHDGTVALGMVRSRPEEIALPSGRTMPPGVSNLGTDLSDDHPVSFTYDRQLYLQHGELADPALLTGAVKLDRAGQLQCTSQSELCIVHLLPRSRGLGRRRASHLPGHLERAATGPTRPRPPSAS